jgi:hypothetical protein
MRMRKRTTPENSEYRIRADSSLTAIDEDESKRNQTHGKIKSGIKKTPKKCADTVQLLRFCDTRQVLLRTCLGRARPRKRWARAPEIIIYEV